MSTSLAPRADATGVVKLLSVAPGANAARLAELMKVVLARTAVWLVLGIMPVVLFWVAVWLSYPVRLQIVRLMERSHWATILAIVGSGVAVLASWLWHTKVRFGEGKLANLALPLGWALAVIVFSLPLVQNWSVPSDPSVLGGLLPSSDASDYLRGARHILVEGTMPSWSCRRPLNAALLSARLLMAQADFRLALILQAVLLGTACFLLARVLAWDFGVTASVLVFVLLFAIGKDHVATTLSESLGLTLGALAAAVLWVGARQRHVPALLAGLFLLTVALDCRAGAFFMLPALVFWCGWAWRQPGRWFDWKFAGLATAVVLAGFAVQVFLRGAYGLGISPGHGNFAYTLYGLSVGVSDWQRVYQDYPAVRTMADAAANDFIYERAWENLSANPWPVWSGLLAGWQRFTNDFLEAVKVWIGFDVFFFKLWLAVTLLLALRWIWLRKPIGLLALALWLLNAFSFVGFWMALACWLAGGWLRLLLRPTGPSNALGFMTAALVGVMLTLPWLADGNVRVLAASYPLMLVAVILGIHGCRRPCMNCDARQHWPARSLVAAPLALGIALVVVALATPAFTSQLMHSHPVPLVLEDSTGKVKQSYLLPGTPRLEISAANDGRATFAPRIRHKHLVRQLELCRAANVPLPELEKLVASGKPFSMLQIYEEDQEVFLVGPPDLPERLVAGTRLTGTRRRDCLYRYFMVD